MKKHKEYQQAVRGNITGIYDLNGCVWEYTAAYITNGNGVLGTNGWPGIYTTSEANPTTRSTKYVTAYPYNSGNDDSEASKAYFKNNFANTRYGDLVIETSGPTGTTSSWNLDYSLYPELEGAFFEYRWWNW